MLWWVNLRIVLSKVTFSFQDTNIFLTCTFSWKIVKNLKQGHTSAKENQPRHVLRNFRNKKCMLSLSSLTKENKTSNDTLVISFTGKHSCGLHNMNNVNETVNAEEVVAVFISESTVIEKEHGNVCSWSCIELPRFFLVKFYFSYHNLSSVSHRH